MERRVSTSRFRRYAWNRHRRCQWCGSHLGWSEATTDHVVPLSAGGTNAWANLVLSCRLCNQSRATGLVLIGPLGPHWTKPKTRRRPR